MPLYFNVDYATVGYECFTFVCGGQTVSGKSSTNLSDNFVYDILPATLDAFVKVDWSSRFRAQVDHDGDGVSDTEETRRNMDPLLPDTDSDGVPDQTEIAKGTNARLSDTDGDGITDYDELIIGSSLNYTLIVRNVGATTTSGVVVNDTLPANVTFLSATTTRDETCPAPVGTLFQCSLAPIASGARVDVTIRVRDTASAVGLIENRASVGSSQSDTDTTNNNAINAVWLR